ncbi:MAG: Do family serine endopeptidase [Candidatus Cloacimonetes bacterium]|nr:Do family serine endopeptidase [Candidatus Syntrophosphaera sp.]NLA45145.1 Do family serine endopeptidase [Candidatus Cloacimonadota bacterium]HNZ45360.1 Do family serine endopeptidase [Candidatus Syntrophosphaera thermopropionivorans]
MKIGKKLIPIILIAIVASCAFAKTGSSVPPQLSTSKNQSSMFVNDEGINPVVKVVRDVRESVVQIKVEAKVNVPAITNPFFDDPLFKYFFPEIPREMQRKITSMGSGFIYEFNPQTREAYIMTNNHVVEKGKEGTITVTLADKINYTAEVVGLDPSTDVAVIKIKVKEGEKVTIAPLGDSSKLEIGEWAIAIGNPFGDVGLDRTVTLGVISAIGRSNLNFGANSPIYQDYIQTDAAINPGNSGGPLLNINGEVIGINSAITSTSGGNIGIGFAIPINLAKRVVEDLVATGKVTRAYIGILPQEITADLMEAFDLSEVSGVLVAKVEKDSPADKAGIQVGDVIIEFNGEKVPNVSKFRIAVATSKPGVQVPVKVIRNKDTLTLHITLDVYPEDKLASTEKSTKADTNAGITVVSIDSPYARQNNIKADRGVVVSAVAPDTPAARAGIQPGYIILKVGNTEVNSPEEYNTAMDNAIKTMKEKSSNTIVLYVQDRSKNEQFVVLRFNS